ncbi:MAG: hypothetical protein WC263_04385 [Candidatus Micrarchaeia archaeon]
MKALVLVGMLFCLIFFGCVSESKPQIGTAPTAQNAQKSIEGNQMAPQEKSELALPPLSEGKACAYLSTKQEMTCNFDASAFTSKTGFNISSGKPFALEKCTALTLITDPVKYEMISLFPYQDEVIAINSETTSNALGISLANPCLMPAAFKDGKLSRDYCFYNSTTTEVYCGRNVSLLHKGIIYNFTGFPVKIDFCGLTAIMDDTNETYFAYIWKNRNSLIPLNNVTGARAVGSMILGEGCES